MTNAMLHSLFAGRLGLAPLVPFVPFFWSLLSASSSRQAKRRANSILLKLGKEKNNLHLWHTQNAKGTLWNI